MDVTSALARYIVESRFSDLPDDVRHEGARSLLNWMACALGGSRHETVERALAALAPFSGPAQATILGRSERLDILHVALMNGISSHVLDFDDTHSANLVHPSGPVASAILALSEYRPVTGAEFLHAFILGIEAECRIANAVFPTHYDLGWHITGTAGVFGAAAAAGKLIGLDSLQMSWALGIAGTQSSGLREMFGSMCKSLHPGRAAQNGLAAALLASKNFTSSDRVLEAPRGFAHVMATDRDFSKITAGLGEGFEIRFNTYKPYACGLVIHPVIDGCVQLRNEHGLAPGDIESIELTVNPLVLDLTGIRSPQTGLQGKFSVFHSAAVAVIYGAAGERECSDECVRDGTVVTLREKIEARAESGMAKDAAVVAIMLSDGRKLERHVEHAIGSLDRPMSDGDLEAKFRGLADSVLTADQTDRLIGLCWDVTALEDAGELARAAQVGPGAITAPER